MKYYHIAILLAALPVFIKYPCFGQAASPKLIPKNTMGVNDDSLHNSEIRNDFKKIYDEYQVAGMFVLYDPKLKKYVFYNPALFRQPEPPASTFNILLTLIGLTEGVIQNDQSRLTDNDPHSTQTNMQKNDFTLENAFTHNIDSFFIKLSLRVGERKIKYWVNKINYGNKSLLGEKGRFWINGALVITPEQQLNFIKDFYYEKFPFPKHAYKVVKKLMLESVVPVPGSNVYGKRGSNKILKSNNFYKEDKYAGWYIGYIESPDNIYYFTNYIESPDVNHPLLVNAQKEIAFKIFKIFFKDL